MPFSPRYCPWILSRKHPIVVILIISCLIPPELQILTIISNPLLSYQQPATFFPMGEANPTTTTTTTTTTDGVLSTVIHHLVAIPFPGRGHINPMLSLCHHLATQGHFLITFIVTEEWLGLLSSSSPPPHKNIRLQTIPNVVPSETTRGANYMAFIMAVLDRMAEPVDCAVGGLDVPADAMLADAMLPWAPQIGKKRGIPVSSLFPESATMFLALQHLSSLGAVEHSLPDLISGTEENKCLEYLPRPTSAYLPDFTSISPGQDTIKIFTKAISWSITSHALLFTSPYALERRALDALKSTLPLPIYAIGPSLLPTTTYSATWLDAQPPSSVLYVSLGSFLPISPILMDELATGLRMSGIRFLLVAREDSTRMQELSGELGLVVPWGDQMGSLCHPSVGGFLTHCGWNSTLEGVCAGVPMLTLPLMWDQFPNSKLVVDEWKVGSRLKDGDGLVCKEEIAKVAREFMDLEREEGKEMRRRARELKEMCGLALEENGSSFDCIHAFVQGIVIRKEKDSVQI